jgi:hypothetical protein
MVTVVRRKFGPTGYASKIADSDAAGGIDKRRLEGPVYGSMLCARVLAPGQMLKNRSGEVISEMPALTASVIFPDYSSIHSVDPGKNPFIRSLYATSIDGTRNAQWV